MRARLRQALPWALAAAILFWIFQRVPAADAWQAAANARLELFAPVALVAVCSWFLLESLAFSYLFTRFNAAVSWAEARSLRGVTYLVTPIHWNLGTAAIVLHLRLSKGIGALESSSSMLFYGLIDGVAFAALVIGGSLALPHSEATATMARAGALVIGVNAVALGLVMARRPGWSWLEWLRSVALLRTHRAATLRDLGILGAIRGLYFLGFAAFIWAGANAFHVALPAAYAVAVTPLVLLAGALPITPAGLGTQQAAMLYFFEPYGSEAAIVAFGLAFPVALVVIRVAIGMLYVREIRHLRRAPSTG